MYWIETVYIKRNEMPLIIRRQKKKWKKKKLKMQYYLIIDIDYFILAITN